MADYKSNKTCEEIDAILDSATPKGEVGDAPNALTLQGARSYAEVLSKASLICAGRITKPYNTGWATIGAEVEIYDAFKVKYGDNAPTITKVVLVDKRVIDGTGASTTRYLYSGDYEGCYFVMGDFEGNDTIFELGATKGDWIIAQNKSWAKIVTTKRDIAGIKGDVTADKLARRLSTQTEDNTNPLVTKSDLAQSDAIEGDITKISYIKNQPFYIHGVACYGSGWHEMGKWGPGEGGQPATILFEGKEYSVERDVKTSINAGPSISVLLTMDEYKNFRLQVTDTSNYTNENRFITFVKDKKRVPDLLLPTDIVRVGTTDDDSSAQTYHGLQKRITNIYNVLDAAKANRSDIVQTDMADMNENSNAYVKNNPIWKYFGSMQLSAGHAFTVRRDINGQRLYLYVEGSAEGVVPLMYSKDGYVAEVRFTISGKLGVRVQYSTLRAISIIPYIDCTLHILEPKALPVENIPLQQADYYNVNPASQGFIANKPCGYTLLAEINALGSYEVYLGESRFDLNDIQYNVFAKDGTHLWNDNLLWGTNEISIDGLNGSLLLDLDSSGEILVKAKDGRYDGWLSFVNFSISIYSNISENYIPSSIARIGYDGDNDPNTLKGAIEQAKGDVKDDIIKEYLNIKPTVRIFHSKNRNLSMVYGSHPYIAKVGNGELVVMHYGKSLKKQTFIPDEAEEEKTVLIRDTRWKELLGAPYNITEYVSADISNYIRFSEPAILPDGQWIPYKDFVSDICERATRVKVYIDEDHPEVQISMAQAMDYYNDNVEAILGEKFYYQWGISGDTTPPYKLFVGNTNCLKIGVALRILNPEYQELVDNNVLEETEGRRWYIFAGKAIPKYLYSDVCEMAISTGSYTEMANAKNPLFMPRLSIK